MRGFSLLVDGVLQVLLQPLGLWVDANFSVALQLSAVGEKVKLEIHYIPFPEGDFM